MPSDILTESRLSPSQAAGILDVNTSTIWRWILRGARGQRLESALVGGRRFTSQEALARFVGRLNAAPGETATFRSPKQRDRAIRVAEAELIQAGA